jgi:hypothetical protein
MRKLSDEALRSFVETGNRASGQNRSVQEVSEDMSAAQASALRAVEEIGIKRAASQIKRLAHSNTVPFGARRKLLKIASDLLDTLRNDDTNP